jgi:UDPglucose 6-dehydrogenase
MTSTIRSICCIGAGYVGGPTMAVIADRCPAIQVTVVDLNASRIAAWNDADLSNLPIYEPGLDKVVGRCRGRNLHFSTEVESAIASADMVFLSVNTPTKLSGFGAGQASDLRWIEASARQVATFACGHTIVVEKSTLPVRTAETVKDILTAAQGDGILNSESKTFSVLSNPEFLAEGTAVSDLENPDRILIGGEDSSAIEALAEIYKSWVPENRILRTNLWSSELSKLTANAFLAQRITSINTISALCEVTGADVREVAYAIGTDNRIGTNFLSAGPGFGGSCFQKDLLNLAYLCNYYGLNEVATYWQNVVDLNTWQQHRISRLVVHKLFGTVSTKRIAVLGFAFKANTNDTRESPSIRICTDLLEEGAQLAVFDPQVSYSQIADCLPTTTEKQPFNDHKPTANNQGTWLLASSPEDAVKNADAAIILTDWDIFRDLNWNQLANLMRKPAWIFNTRTSIDISDIKSNHVNIWQLGANNL